MVLQGAVRRGDGHRVSVLEDGIVLEMVGGDDCTTR